MLVWHMTQIKAQLFYGKMNTDSSLHHISVTDAKKEKKKRKQEKN